MAKVELEMELGEFTIKGFKIRLRGDREDLPRISTEIGKHFAGMVQPPANLLDAPVHKQVESRAVVPDQKDEGNGRGKNNRRSKGARAQSAEPVVIEWQHDPGKWGNPKQKWKAGHKLVWMLYVIKNATGQIELAASSMADTFNTKFKQFGTVKKTSMPSIMGSLKTHEPALVIEDTTKSPIVWLLSEQGLKLGEELVQEARTTDQPGIF
jgi:hypothetical protein